MNDKNVQWVYLAEASLLTDRPCWLHFAYLNAAGDSAANALYDGHDNKAKKITDIWCGAAGNFPFSPSKPVYCHQGLYVEVEDLNFMFVEYETEANHPPGPQRAVRPEDQAEVAGQV